MRTAIRWAILAVACLAMAFSLAPLTAHATTPQNPNSGGDSGSSGSSWKVVCSYDSQDHFLGKTCTSGGTDSCACP